MNSQPSDGDASQDISSTEDLAFRACLVRQLYAQSRTGIVGALVSTFVVALAIREHVDNSWLVAWLAVYLAVQVPRFYLAGSFPGAGPSDRDIVRWETRFSVLTILSGLLWGSTAIIAFPKDSAIHQMFLCIALARAETGGDLRASVGRDL